MEMFTKDLQYMILSTQPDVVTWGYTLLAGQKK